MRIGGSQSGQLRSVSFRRTEARRIASNITKLPALLSRKIRKALQPLGCGQGLELCSLSSCHIGVDVILHSEADSIIHISTMR
jgi:hypothetical protein